MLAIYLLVALATGVRSSLLYSGVDWSSAIEEENRGVKYKNQSGYAEPLEIILVQNGVNTVRQRLWVNPRDGTYNLAYNIKLAKRAQAAGMQVYLDMHLSDSWADPNGQGTPAGWSTTSIDDLEETLYKYTLNVSNTFAANNIPLSIISVGNEIAVGLLFPLGKRSNYTNVARLLHAGCAGIKDSKLPVQPKIMIHLHNGWNWTLQNTFYTNVLSKNIFLDSDFDMMGVSYYPFNLAPASLGNLSSSLGKMAATWGKEIVVAELDWPEACPSVTKIAVSDTSSIPVSDAGQTTIVEDVANVLGGVSRGVGLFWWEPAWISNAQLGVSCLDALMFDQTGKARNSLSVFGKI